MMLSICPFLKGIGGHDIPYQDSLRLSLGSNLKIRILATIAARSVHLPEDYAPVLPIYTSGKSVVYWYSYVATIGRELDKIGGSDRSVFIESFGLGHLLGIGIASLISTNKIDRLIILIRSNLIVNKLYKVAALKGILFFIQNLLKIKIYLSSDSALVCNFLYKKFNMEATLLPIPHTNFGALEKQDHRPILSRAMICWMPGNNRLEKNYDVAVKLISSSDKLKHHILWAPESLKHLATFHNKHKFFQKALTEQEYQKNLFNCDVILLPYNSHIYEMATSGIFVECIIAGKWPITSKNSWMSYELNRYGLHELSIVWGHENAEIDLQKAFSLMWDKKYLDRLKAMRIDYLNFHCQSKFKDVFESSLLR